MRFIRNPNRKFAELDYIPDGRMLTKQEFTELAFRSVREGELFQCGALTGRRDPQSGPYYCGEVACKVSETEEGVAAYCSKHKPGTSIFPFVV